jgi:hypothetical protein
MDYLRQPNRVQGSQVPELATYFADLGIPVLPHKPKSLNNERIFRVLLGALRQINWDNELKIDEIHSKAHHYGYFQRAEYFTHRVKNFVLDAYRQQYDKVTLQNAYTKDTGEINCIHLRGGDYLNQGYNRESIGALDFAYYCKILSDHDLKSRPWLIISNDRNRAIDLRRHVKMFNVEAFTSFEIFSDTNVHRDLDMMIAAERLIVANSSFSAMAAYLSTAKSIFAPSPWFRSRKLSSQNPALNNWILTPASFEE